ncbi:MAG TPA: M23 family metallopeptidase [Gaiellaceae bacterium]|jgi:hypothetical protein
MLSHRTTARGILSSALCALCALGVAAGSATGASPRVSVPASYVFPVVGPVQYEDDFGQPRSGGTHEGNDILAAHKAVAVAVESGKVKFWTTSASAGCMLYLYGESGTTYLYIHLNNDLTKANDNRGKCIPGVSYARGLKDGAKVQAGQQVGYVGDSGDADGLHPHLHFEVHPGGGSAVDPYAFLQAATPLLFFAKAKTPFALALTGTVMSATEDSLEVQVSLLQAFPSGLKLKDLTRTVKIAVPPSTVVEAQGVTSSTRLLADYGGQPVVVWTQPALATLKAERGDDGALTAALVQLG